MRLFFIDYLTAKIAGYVGDMDPSGAGLKDELGELESTQLVRLLRQSEQAAMVIGRAGYQVGGATEEVVAVLGSPDKGVQFGAAIAATDNDGSAPDPP